MRFLHIADLHLGKQMNDISLMEDQQDILNKRGPEVKRLYNEYNDDDTKPYKSKLILEALKDYGIGMGQKKVNGRNQRVFMRQDESKQKVIGDADEEN